MGREYPVSRGEPPLLQKGKGIILSQKSRKKVATLFYTFSEGGKKMSEKQEKKNVLADGEMAAGRAATMPHGNAAAANKK